MPNDKLISEQSDIAMQDTILTMKDIYTWLLINHYLLFHITMMSAYLGNERMLSVNVSDDCWQC